MDATAFVTPIIASGITVLVLVGIFVVSQTFKYGGLANQVKTNTEQLRDYQKLRERLTLAEDRVKQLRTEMEIVRNELPRKADR